MTLPSHANTFDQLTTLFALGREVAVVLDLDELLHKIPTLIARLTNFKAFAVYLLDPKGDALTIAYSVGYPEETTRTLHMKVGHGLVGAAVESGQPILVNDVHLDPRYVEAVPGAKAELVVPLRRKGRNSMACAASQAYPSGEPQKATAPRAMPIRVLITGLLVDVAVSQGERD